MHIVFFTDFDGGKQRKNNPRERQREKQGRLLRSKDPRYLSGEDVDPKTLYFDEEQGDLPIGRRPPSPLRSLGPLSRSPGSVF